jgi:hypothetical protein
MRFEILKHSPRRAHRRVNDDKLALLMDTPTKRPTPLLKGGVGERLWSLGEEASDPRHESKCAIRNSGGPLSQSGGSAFGVLGAKPER